MDWDDILEDERYDDGRDNEIYTKQLSNNLNTIMEQLELEQPIILKKSHFNAYSVERDFVNSKEYHDKFELLPVNRDVQQRLYIEAGRLLNFVDGQEEERMLAINARTGEFLVDNFDRKGSIKGTGFNSEEAKILDNCRDGIILLHNHSLNGRPSAQDILTYLDEEKIKISLILCHDGTVYGIYGVNPKFSDIYNEYLMYEKQRTDDLDEAKRLATTQMYLLNEKLGNRHKLFILKKL